MKLKGDIFKDHSDKLGLLWTNDQWQTVMNAMDEYAKQQVQEIGDKIEEMYSPSGILCQELKSLMHSSIIGILLEKYGYEAKPPFEK